MSDCASKLFSTEKLLSIGPLHMGKNYILLKTLNSGKKLQNFGKNHFSFSAGYQCSTEGTCV